MSVETLPRDPASARELRLPDAVPPARGAVRGLQLTPAVGAAGLAVCLLVSLWLRTSWFSVHYWIDEAISVGIASHPLSQLPDLLRQDGSPPLYYLLLHFWMDLRGNQEVATHELSLLFAMLSVPVAYWAGTSLFDRRVGLLCAALGATLPYFTYYGQETRMYSLLALLSLLVAASFMHAFIGRRRRYLPVFSVSLAAALYTHNWALFLAVMAFLAYLVCLYALREERRAVLRDGALAFGGVAVLYAPWLPTLIYQAKHTGAPWALSPVFWSMTQGLYSLVYGRAAAVALLLGAGGYLIALRERGADRRTQLSVVCLLVMGVGTLLLAWLYSKSTPAWANRYLAVLVGPLLLVFGLGLARSGRLGLFALALSVCFWILQPVPHSKAWKSNVQEVELALRPYLGHDPLVISTQPEEVPAMAYYLSGPARYMTPLGPVPDPRVVDWRNALERFEAARPRSSLIPEVNALRPGQRVMILTPLRFTKSPLWMHLIWKYSMAYSRLLMGDRHLRLLTSSNAYWWSSSLPVRGAVFVRRY